MGKVRLGRCAEYLRFVTNVSLQPLVNSQDADSIPEPPRQWGFPGVTTLAARKKRAQSLPSPRRERTPAAVVKGLENGSVVRKSKTLAAYEQPGSRTRTAMGTGGWGLRPTCPYNLPGSRKLHP